MSVARKLKAAHLDGVKSSILCPEDNYLMLIENLNSELDAATWAAENRKFLEGELAKHGAILFRGFSVGLTNFEKVVEGIVTKAGFMEYKAGYSPRKKLSEKVYTSTVFPAELHINQHQDQCYLPQFPRKLFLCSEIPAKKGGETPLTSARKFMKLIDPKIVERVSSGVLYIRVLSEDAHMSWQDSYWTKEKSEAEKSCRRQGMRFEWLPNDAMKTFNLSHGLIKHPITGEKLWFNQAHTLSLYSDVPGRDSPAMRAERNIRSPEKMKILENTKPIDRFNVVCYSNGKPIEVSILDEIHQILEENKFCFTWEKGDFLMMDNLATFHGRNPFEGERLTLATQAQAWSPDELKLVKSKPGKRK